MKWYITDLGRKKLRQFISRVNYEMWAGQFYSRSVSYFSPYSGRKYHIRVSELETKVALSAGGYGEETFLILTLSIQKFIIQNCSPKNLLVAITSHSTHRLIL